MEVYTKLRKSECRVDPTVFLNLPGIVEIPSIVKPQLKRRVSAWATKKHTRVYR